MRVVEEAKPLFVFNEVHARQAVIDNELARLNSEMAELKAGTATLKHDLGQVRAQGAFSTSLES